MGSVDTISRRRARAGLGWRSCRSTTGPEPTEALSTGVWSASAPKWPAAAGAGAGAGRGTGPAHPVPEQSRHRLSSVLRRGGREVLQARGRGQGQLHHHRHEGTHEAKRERYAGDLRTYQVRDLLY